MGSFERPDLMSAFAEAFAEKCANFLLARLPRPNVIQPRCLTVQQAAAYRVADHARNLNVQPTIKVPVGYKFIVRVNRDILFEAPYEPVRTESPVDLRAQSK